MYRDLAYGQDELARVMRTTYDELIDFVSTPEFTAVMEEFSTLEGHERPSFVLTVLLDREELARRGVRIPEGILIQRSAFGDRRPTLFCVKKYLPVEYRHVWENVNLTFDNYFADESVSRAPEIAWRQPLAVEVQAKIIATQGDLEQV